MKGIVMGIEQGLKSVAAKSVIAPNTGKLKNPADQIRTVLKSRQLGKMEKEIESIITKPAAQRTFKEKMELAYYNTARGLLDMKNYPPVIY